MGIALVLLPVSCATPGLGTYGIHLSRVQQDPALEQSLYAETSTAEKEGITYYHYRDNKINIDWHIENTRFAFSLSNVSGQSIRIPWDEAVYVDQDGKAKRVIHDGIAFERKNEAQPLSVVPHGAGIDDFLLPADNIVPENKNYVSWQTFYLFYDREKNVGQEVKVILPIVMQDHQYDYVFTFKVTQWQEDEKKRGLFSFLQKSNK